MSEPVKSRVITEPLGGSPLSLAVQTGRLPANLRLWRPSGQQEWSEHVARVRPADGAWLERVRPALDPAGEAARRLERTVAERGVVVTTGQQPGLFGGPVYTLSKALSALALADELQSQLGTPVAPIFWAASDDADFLEASVAHVADADGLEELKLTRTPPPGTPMSDVLLGDLTKHIEVLRKASGSAAHAAFYELARSAFSSERTLGGAYVRLMRGLLEPLGIAVLDASHPACREAARDILRDALQRAADVSRATTECGAAIRQAGFEPQVEDDRGLSLVFAIEKGVKRRIAIAEAKDFAVRAATTVLSPNVLLRPVIERGILPTAAYVAGPGELAYFIQSNAVSRALDRDRVVGVPRWSCTVIEPHVERALRRLGIQHFELKDLHALEKRLATASLPEGVAGAWRRLQEAVTAAVRNVGSVVDQSSLMPPAVIEGLERSLAHRLSRTERRLLAAAKRRNEQVRHDLEVASASLYPMGKRQERVLNYVPMLARSGNPLLDEMRAAAAAHAASLIGTGRPEPAAAR